MATVSSRTALAAALLLALAGAGAVWLTQHDEPPPVVVAASSPAALASVPPSFDVARVSSTGSAVFAGRAEPRATVSVQSNGVAVGEVKADARGEWVFVPSTPLPAGAQDLTLVARGPGGTDTRSSGELLLVVPDRAVPGTSAPGAAAPDPVIAVLAPPTGALRTLVSPAPATTNRLTLDVVDYDAGGQIRFTGASAANAPVRIYVDNAAVGDARADAAGHWTLEPGAAVKPGVHALRVDQIGARGQVVSRVELPFQRADLPSLEPGRVVVQPGQNLWRLARAAYGAGMRYTVIYRANQDQIRNPDRIYPGQAFNMPGGS